MPEDKIHQPNDKLFSSTFGVPENTAGLLRAKLPSALAAVIDWKELRLRPGSFVDSQFRRSHTDLLFSAPISDREGFLYLLFEHQSSRDRLLPLRLLRYMSRIWESVVKADEGSSKLPVILPVVLSQNAEAWEVSPNLVSLLDVPEEFAAVFDPYLPDFAYVHLQLAEMPFETIPGTASGVFVLRVMKAERLGRLLDDAVWDESVLLHVPRDVFQMVLRYILGGDIDKEGFENRVEVIRDPELRSNAMSLAQQYRQEGRQEGLTTYLLEALEIRFGNIPYDLRERILGLADEARLRELHRLAIQCRSLEAFVDALSE